MENTEKSQTLGFERGLQAVYRTRTAAEFDQCKKECYTVCTTTERRANSLSSYYNKRFGRRVLSVAERERIAEIFAKYGVTDWEGCENEA